MSKEKPATPQNVLTIQMGPTVGPRFDAYLAKVRETIPEMSKQKLARQMLEFVLDGVYPVVDDGLYQDCLKYLGESKPSSP